MRFKLLCLLLLTFICPALAQPTFSVNDFVCFSNKFTLGDPYCDCDGNSLLNANDYQCFLNRYAARDPYANCDNSNSKGPAWTNLTPAPTARVIYVSESTGNDANVGSQISPVKTLGRGYALLRDGFPDQLLLKSGDTWNEPLSWAKASGSAQSPMVMASYGTGPRPRIRPSGSALTLGRQNKLGVAFVGLDLAPQAPASFSSGIQAFCPWSYVTVEDCLISGFAVNIAVQEIDASRSTGWRIRYNIIVDSKEPGSGHSQGLFMGSCDNTLIEGNTFDLNAIDKADMFCHNVYLHETNGPSTFHDNITTRACSHGVQQRSGGVMINNFSAQCPVNLFQGDASGILNSFQYNVALDSRNINSIDVRGFGFWLNGSAGSNIFHNVAAHQRLGTGNVVAFNLDGVTNGFLYDNAVLDWTYNGANWGIAYDWDSGTTVASFLSNRSWMVTGGICLFNAGPGQFANNRYFTTTSPAFVWSAGVQDPTALANPGPIDASISAYMASIGQVGGLPEFLAKARLQSKVSWDPRFTSDAVNDFVRSRLGVQSN